MMTVDQKLSKFSVTKLQAWSFVFKNICSGNAQAIYDAAIDAKLTFNELLNIFKIGNSMYNAESLNYFFSYHKVDISKLHESTSKSNKIESINYDDLLDESYVEVSSLQSGKFWSKQQINFGFNEYAPAGYSVFKNLAVTESGNLVDDFTAARQELRDAFREIAVNADSIAKFDLIENKSADISVQEIETSEIAGGFAFYPGQKIYSGDIFIDKKMTSFEKGSYGYFALVHELGHALGLKHPFEGRSQLNASDDNRVNTIMSYTDYKHISVRFNVENPQAFYDEAYATSFMINDIAALQTIYGVDTAAHTDDTVYKVVTDNSIKNTDTYTVLIDSISYMTIWDAGGSDTIDLSATTYSNRIDLTAGSRSDINYRSVEQQINETKADFAKYGSFYNGWITDVYDQVKDYVFTGENAIGIAHGAVIENAIGGSADDVFIDNLVDNVLSGGNGNDTFYLSAGGYDKIFGGEGSDKVVLQCYANDVMINYLDDFTLIESSKFAAELVGVEQIVFADKSVFL